MGHRISLFYRYLVDQGEFPGVLQPLNPAFADNAKSVERLNRLYDTDVHWEPDRLWIPEWESALQEFTEQGHQLPIRRRFLYRRHQ